MKRALWLSVVLCLAISAGAAPFGELFPVTNTRYRGAIGEPRLVPNDRDFFLFWGEGSKIRAARIDEGEARVSHVVLDTGKGFDAAWTGEQYVIVSSRASGTNRHESGIVGRVLDAEAHPAGAEFNVAPPDGFDPRIAAGSHSIAVVYAKVGETRVVTLSKNGRIESPSRVIGPQGMTHAVARLGDGFLAIIAIEGTIRAVALDRYGQTIAENTLSAGLHYYRSVAVASNGTSALAMWADYGKVMVVPVDEHAAFGTPLELASGGGQKDSTVLWNGAGWTASYAQNVTQAVIVHLDERAQTILSRQEGAAEMLRPTIAALDGRFLAAWRTSSVNQSPVVAALPLTNPKPRPTPWVASRQTLLASASSSEATLIVWSEITDGGGASIHAGVRNLQGQWSERQVATSPHIYARARAASDGSGFAIVLNDGSGSLSLILLDAAGRPSGAPVPLPPIQPAVMAWNGTNYGLIGWQGGVLISPTGTVSSVVDIDLEYAPTAMASDGNGFFLAGTMVRCDADILCIAIPYEIRGTRLGPDLKRVGEDFRVPRQPSPGVVGAAWDGSRYFLIGQDEVSGTFLSYIPQSPQVVLDVQTIEVPLADAMTLLRDGTIAIYARTSNTTHRVWFVNGEGLLLHTSDIEGTTIGSTVDESRLEALADGGAAFITTAVQNAAPHDGTNRIATAIARSSNTPPPGAPHIGVRVQNGVMRIDWTAPSGTVNGYRLEYRVDDDEWVEWEQWFGPGVQSKSIRQPSFGTQFAFRVRAFNDGGAGAYSGTALTKPSRRRAVR